MLRKNLLRKIVFLGLVMLVLPLSASPAWAGGWSVATLDRLPACVIAEEPLEIGFVVRQHGVSTLEGLTPIIVAHEQGENEKALSHRLIVEAEEDTPGHYTAELVFPAEGTWEWMFSAFGPDQAMPTLSVLPAGEACPDADETPTVAELAELGSQLFLAKGCAVCHQHDAASFDAFASINAGPELTDYRSDAEFLCRWLDDPAAVRPKTYMPTLGLSDDEIEALVMFLNFDEDADAAAPGWCGDLLARASGDE